MKKMLGKTSRICCCKLYYCNLWVASESKRYIYNKFQHILQMAES